MDYNYNQYPNGSAQPPYGPTQEEREAYFSNLFFRKNNEKKGLRTLGIYAGLSYLAYRLLANIAQAVLLIFGALEKVGSDPYYSMLFEIIGSLVFMGLPFVLFGILSSKKIGGCDIAPLGAPKDKKLFFLAIPTAIGWCMAANIATSYIIAFMSALGLELSQPDLPTATNGGILVLNIIRACVIAPIVEEVTIRGCIMQPLRKYSDSFAIIMSACIFGFIHGNLIQAPFALIAGMVLGYIAIKTESLWTSVIAHALNNLISVIFTYVVADRVSDQTFNLIYLTFIAAAMIIGVVTTLFFIKRARAVSPQLRTNSLLSPAEKTAAYVLNPAIIISIIIILFITSAFVKLAV